MKILHYFIITIFTTILVVASNNAVFADNSASYGGLTGYRQAHFQGNHGSYPIWYKLTNATVVSTILDLPAKALLFEINTTSNGQLIVQLPRTIIDSKNGSEDVPYFASVYDIRSLGGPTKISPEEINNNDLRILEINFTKDITEIEIAGTFFVEKYHYAAPNSISSLSPLRQYETGLAANDVKCIQGLQLVIKAEDNSPACVKPDTGTKLVKRGWGIFGESSLVNSDIHGKNGTLYGTVVLAGGPSSMIGPKSNYEVDVYAVDGITLVGKTFSDANAHYFMQLPAGNYTVYVPDYPAKQTHFVSVFPGENTILNIVYGTGYK
jgi:hypothetical protein